MLGVMYRFLKYPGKYFLSYENEIILIQNVCGLIFQRNNWNFKYLRTSFYYFLCKHTLASYTSHFSSSRFHSSLMGDVENGRKKIWRLFMMWVLRMCLSDLEKIFSMLNLLRKIFFRKQFSRFWRNNFILQ